MVRSIVASKLKEIIEEEKNSKHPSVFLGGLCDDKNEWRNKIKEEFKDKLFLVDPYDPHWEAEDNIYDELAAMVNADYIVFYKGGKGTEKEKWFMDNTDREYAAYDDLDKLRAYLTRASEPVKKSSINPHGLKDNPYENKKEMSKLLTDEDDLSRYGCKNIGIYKGHRQQCNCSAHIVKGLPNLYLTNKKASVASLLRETAGLIF